MKLMERNKLFHLMGILLPSYFLLLFIIYAIYINFNNELTTSGGFPGRIIAFIQYNKFVGNYNVFYPATDNFFYINNMHSMAEHLPALAILFIILSEITAISPQTLMLIPFGVFFSSLSYYVLFKTLFKKKEIAFLSLAYVLVYVLTSSDQLGGYVASWTFILFCLYIIVNYKLLENKKPSLIISLFLLYLGIHIFWHTFEARALFFIVSINVIIHVINILHIKNDSKFLDNTTLILAAMIIVTIYFKKLLYEKSGYLSQLSINVLIQSQIQWFQSIAAKIGILSIKTQSTSIYYYSESSTINSISTYAGIGLILIIALPIIISCIIDLISIVKNKYITNTNLSIIKWSLIFTQIAITIAYAFAGGAGPGLIIQFFPVASVIGIYGIYNCKYESSMWRSIFTSKKIHCKEKLLRAIYTFFIIIVVVNSIYSAPYILKHYQQKSISFDDSSAVSDWFVEKTLLSDDMSQLVISDFSSAGKMMVLLSEKGKIFNYECFNDQQLQLITESTSNPPNWDWMLINFKQINLPIKTDQGWAKLKPLSNYMHIIESNARIDKVYNDGLYVLYTNNIM
jgi:hypothetical protein